MHAMGLEILLFVSKDTNSSIPRVLVPLSILQESQVIVQILSQALRTINIRNISSSDSTHLNTTQYIVTYSILNTLAAIYQKIQVSYQQQHAFHQDHRHGIGLRSRNLNQRAHEDVHSDPFRRCYSRQLPSRCIRQGLPMQTTAGSLRCQRRKKSANGDRCSTNPLFSRRCYTRRWLLPNLAHLGQDSDQG